MTDYSRVHFRKAKGDWPNWLETTCFIVHTLHLKGKITEEQMGDLVMRAVKRDSSLNRELQQLIGVH